MIDQLLARQVIEIAQKAADAILDIYAHVSDVEIQQKGDASPLTLADRTANRLICDALAELSVSFPIISEENKEVPYEARKDYEYFWLVDPLDGTKEFIKRNGEFTVNIALVHRQTPVLGVVSVPVQSKIYWAVRGEGSFVKDAAGVRQLSVSSFEMSASELNVVSSRSHLNAETEAYIARLRQPRFVPVGSALKFMYVAEGKADLYPRFIPCMEWDTAASDIIVAEAGGRVLQTETQQPLVYNKPNLLSPYFLALGKTESDLML